MPSHGYQHLFGPVPSRRFGRSLGIDLTPSRACSLDCVFCQVGRTRDLTRERREYVPTNDVCDELSRWVESGGTADIMTLAGSGEPTLHTGFGRVLNYAAEISGSPTLLLSNGTLFPLPEVRMDAAHADIVKVSLSAWDADSFDAVNRPHPSLHLEQILDGYRAFREEFTGQLHLEVILVQGINDAPEQVARIAALATSFSPDVIQLNTVVRPPADGGAAAVAGETVDELAGLFTPQAEPVRPRAVGALPGDAQAGDMILAMVRRHPCTVREVSDMSGMSREDTDTCLSDLEARELVRFERRGAETYVTQIATDEPHP